MENNDLYLPQDEAPGRTTPIPYTLVADDAFPLTRHTMKPYATDLNVSLKVRHHLCSYVSQLLRIRQCIVVPSVNRCWSDGWDKTRNLLGRTIDGFKKKKQEKYCFFISQHSGKGSCKASDASLHITVITSIPGVRTWEQIQVYHCTVIWREKRCIFVPVTVGCETGLVAGGQSFRLLTMRSRVRFPVVPWEFFLAGEDPHSDHGLGSLYNLGLTLSLLMSYICGAPCKARNFKRRIYSGPSSYAWLPIRTTWFTIKILVLTYDQSLELRHECRSRPLELRPARRS
jgi:hypothetical protein